jgi:hypothetical protein
MQHADMWLLLIVGPSVVNVYINYEKKFAFVEFRTGEASTLPCEALTCLPCRFG